MLGCVSGELGLRAYLESAGHTFVVTADKESLIYRPIKDLADVLDPSTFWQIHRGTIVNIRQISGITRDYRGRLRVKIKERSEMLPVSESHVHLFKQM